MKTQNLGLDPAVAEKLLQKFGKNRLKSKSAHPWWRILASQFADLLVVILIVAAGISFLAREQVDSIVIFVIVILNAAIGFFQEFRAERTLEALKKMIHPEIRVRRGGREFLIGTEFLVPGDIAILGEGARVPADGNLIESHSCEIDESALTGESSPVEKSVGDEIFMGTAVVRGSATVKISATGMRTQFGKIARLTTATAPVPSPLQRELARIGIFVTKVTLGISAILWAMAFFRGESLLDALTFAVSVAIAAVPEGLPTTITIALALGAAVLSRKRVAIRRLSSVETLGAVSTICSDKTGTLTKNQMTVREIWLADRSIFEVSGAGYDPRSGKISLASGSATKKNRILRKKLFQISAICTEAKLIEKNGVFSILGDPTEGALLTLVAKSGKKLEESADEIFPFDSGRKMMSVLSKNQILAKGSPESILEKCDFWTDGEKISKLTSKKREEILGEYRRMAKSALRVLAFAERKIADGEIVDSAEKSEKNLVFVGLAGMLDPPRREVSAAVKKCRAAGVRILVITGDFGETAGAIARELGIAREGATILSGKQVEKMSDAELDEILSDRDREVIFARSLPEQKMRIVQILQKHGEIVAMTGDGVNDAPALKSADIGVAMGSGTEVSREAASMVLTNDSFASIVTAVEEGRRIYENLKKFTWFIFSANIGELFVIFAAILFQLPLPLTAVLILCVDLGTDILPAIALGVDSAEKNSMRRPPRNPEQKMLNREFVGSFLATGIVIGASVTVAFLWKYSTGASLESAQTLAFSALVFVQLIHAFSSRSATQSIFRQNPLENHFLLIAVFTSILMVGGMIFIPFFNETLGTTPLNLEDFAVVFVASIAPLIFVEGWKMRARKKLENSQKI